jgi:hypothetical protein
VPEEDAVESYIVRIYRFEKNNPRNLVGIVESVEHDKRDKTGFTCFDELWEILNSHGCGADYSPEGPQEGGSRGLRGIKDRVGK